MMLSKDDREVFFLHMCADNFHSDYIFHTPEKMKGEKQKKKRKKREGVGVC